MEAGQGILMAEGSRFKAQGFLENENTIEQWLAAQEKSLRQVLEQYKAQISTELFRTQRLLARATEERDLLLKKLIEAQEKLRRIRETFND